MNIIISIILLAVVVYVSINTYKFWTENENVVKKNDKL